ncbi:MAG: hypothetical protein ACYSU0_01925 [Planctomycetota bacterium]
MFPVVFEDKDLGVDVRQEIVNDLESMYRRPLHWLYRPHRPAPFTVNGKLLPIVGRFRPYDGLRIRLQIGLRTLRLDSGRLEVSKKLSDFYQQAFARKAKNETAYVRLEAFVDYLSNVERRDFPGWKDVYYFHGGKRRSREALESAGVRSFQELYRPYTCRVLSALHVQRGFHPDHFHELVVREMDAPFEYDDPESKLTARACFLDKKGRVRFYNHLVYDGGRWKIWFDSSHHPIAGIRDETGERPVLADFQQAPLRLSIMDAEYQLLFEDSALGGRRREAMAADLQKLLGRPQHHMSYGRLWTYYAVWSKSCRRGFRLVEVEGAEYLLVQKAMSDAYEESFKAIEDNPMALTHLESFLDYMNHIEEREWVGVENLVYPCFLASYAEKLWQEYRDKGKEDFLRGWHRKGKKRRLAYPSALAIAKPSDRLTERELRGLEHDMPELIASLHRTDDEGRFEGEWPFVYHNGKWKMLLPFGGE